MDKESLKPIKSRSISGYSYNSQDKTLLVEFTNGSQYQYKNIDPPTMSSVFDAPGSKGRLFSRLIASKHSGSKIQ